MKKIFILLSIFLVSLGIKAQTTTTSETIEKKSEIFGSSGNNEIKINLLFGILGIPEISYERLIANNMGLGFSASLGLNSSEFTDIYKFAFTPHYRIYFGAKKADGFFIEGNTALLSVRGYRMGIEEDYIIGENYKEKHTINIGLGATVGTKFLTRNGFIGEAYIGAIRVLNERRSIEVYPRAGITIGKRF